MNQLKKYRLLYIYLTLILLFLIIINLSLGSVIIPIKSLLSIITNTDTPQYVKDIVISFRVPKVITAIMAGAALSVCGVQMQTLFRNPLADPYILGISSGAGLGVAIYVMGASVMGLSMDSSLISNLGIASSAWLGAAAITTIILIVSLKLKDNISLLIFGIMLASVVSAIISLIQYLSSASSLKSFVVWTMGSFSGLSYNQIIILTVLLIVGMGISIYNIKDLNTLLMGEIYSKNLGVKLQKTRLRILVATTLLAGGVTAFCGPIGFIGIAVPHISRMIFKNSNHKILLPASALVGSIIMVLADTVAQLPGSSGVIPINTVSALIGVPVIFAIILKNRIS